MIICNEICEQTKAEKNQPGIKLILQDGFSENDSDSEQHVKDTH